MWSLRIFPREIFAARPGSLTATLHPSKTKHFGGAICFGSPTKLSRCVCSVALVQDRLIRSYLVLFGVGGVLAELDTPFAKANFRALQKWWFKAPFYVL